MVAMMVMPRLTKALTSRITSCAAYEEAIKDLATMQSWKQIARSSLMKIQ